mgnify:CR=1 FL=1
MKVFEHLQPADWKAFVDEENAQLIDVRMPVEFEDSFIKGATNIDVNSPSFSQAIGKFVHAVSAAQQASV